MAVIGQSRWPIAVKFFDDATQDWPGPFIPDMYFFYSGMGFGLPLDQNWINRPTGTEDHGGMVMGFPRSAEAIPPTPGAAVYFPEYIHRRL